jgi:3-hydroxyisobutyrate dehydrogenase-like beta-hydroxyacid dehydrogenase
LESPGAVALQSDVVIVAVVTTEQVAAVLKGPNGILASAGPELVVVIVSTIAVSALLELAEEARQHGVHLIDAGVTPGDKAASDGLVALAGGDDAVIESIRPILAEFSSLVLHMGPLGSGMAAKIARNIITYGVWHIVYEAGLLAEKAGIDLRRLVEAVRASDPQGNYATSHLQRRGTVAPIEPDDTAARARAAYIANLLHKDLEAALALADSLKVHLPAVSVVISQMDQMLGLKERT